MATPIRLDEAMEQIVDALADRIEAARQQDGPLAALEYVAVGNRTRVGFDLPMLWVLPEDAQIVQRHALVETWSMPVLLTAIAQGDEPEDVSRLVRQLANRARTAVAYGPGNDRRLGLRFVADVQSERFIPSHETSLDHRTIYSAAAVVNVRFHVFETGG